MFRILSVDGGGVRGLLPLHILRNLEQYLNDRDGVHLPIGKRFDFICGTSIGGIIALALSLGESAVACQDHLTHSVESVFSAGNRSWLPTRLFRPKYNPEPLRQSLANLFGKKTLRDAVTDVCITGVSLQNARPRLYKTDYFKRNVGRLDEPLVDVALATAAAPTYFPAHSSAHSADLLDGGLVANNPALIALVDACLFERPSKLGTSAPESIRRNSGEIAMLSLGTGEQCGMPYDSTRLRSGGLYNWARPILEVIMQAQSEAVHHQANFLLGNSYLRVNPLLKFPMKLDDVSKMAHLKNLSDVTAEIEQFAKTYL
jgi:patatin-like phospholipase/acyl hydrolase